MTRRSLIERLTEQEDVNFLFTNHIPRRAFTLAMGWFSRIEHPLIRTLSLATWRLFAGPIDLSEAKKTHFDSLHDCFVRELRAGARLIDPDPAVVVSPCDGIIGAWGRIAGTEVLQAKGQPYTIDDLLGDPAFVAPYRDGWYVTLRLTSTMYHRFHAPYDCEVDHVTYISGDTWNVNPIALKRVARLFCKNERAIIPLRLKGSRAALTLVPVAAILVASIHLEFLDVTLHLRHRGPDRLACRASLEKGQEMGHFRHGSTIVVLASRDFEPCPGLSEGDLIKVGRALLRHR